MTLTVMILLVLSNPTWGMQRFRKTFKPLLSSSSRFANLIKSPRLQKSALVGSVFTAAYVLPKIAATGGTAPSRFDAAYNFPHQLSCLQYAQNFFAAPLEKAFEANGVKFITHVTPCKNVAGILKTGKLKSGQEVGNANYNYEYEDRKFGNQYIFLSFSNEKTLEHQLRLQSQREKHQAIFQTAQEGQEGASSSAQELPDKMCTMIFSLDILPSLGADWHLGRGWFYGKRYSGYYSEDDSSAFYAESGDILGMSKMLTSLSGGPDEYIGQNEIVVRRPVELGQFLVKVIGQ
jgi:hypothetical protein